MNPEVLQIVLAVIAGGFVREVIQWIRNKRGDKVDLASKMQALWEQEYDRISRMLIEERAEWAQERIAWQYERNELHKVIQEFRGVVQEMAKTFEDELIAVGADPEHLREKVKTTLDRLPDTPDQWPL